MKKLIYGACTVLLIAGASCSKDNAKTADQLPAELCDSISMYSGASIGGYVLSDYLNYIKTADTEISKKEIVKGVQLAFSNADEEGTVIGIQIGTQILNQIKRYEEQGININRSELLKNFRRAFEADTLDMGAITEANTRMNDLMAKAQNIKEEREKAAAAEAAEASKAETEEYINNLKAEDPEIKTTESGLSYKILNPGDEPRVQDNSSIDVNYVGRLTDGTVFDQSQDKPATFSPSGVIPGFAEGLKMLGKGGKAILYIPGDLAYGANGVPQAGIGPNAMLIFEVEVVDVHNPE